MNGSIVNIATQVPAYPHAQADILEFMKDFHGREAKRDRQLNVLYNRSRIDRRHSVIPDFGSADQSPLLFKSGTPPGLSKRLEVFQKEAIPLAVSAATKAMAGFCDPGDITDVITVSCTGLYAPGLEFQLITELGLPGSVERHPVNFVGCYASIPALNLANLICHRNPRARVLLVSVELCTIHLQPDTDRDNLTANAIFSDGCAACLIEGADLPSRKGLQLGPHFAEVHPKGAQDMTWVPAESGFLIRLSSYVPLLISEEIHRFVHRALEQSGLKKEQMAWAFHPGGAQIIGKIREALELSTEDVTISEKVLREHGNMSSSTILYVLKEMLDDPGRKEHVFASAFGPGLTFESILLRHV